MFRRTDSSSRSLKKNLKSIVCLGVMSLVSWISDHSVMPSTVQAQGKAASDALTNFKSEDLLLTADHGPWLIMAMAFEGEGAKSKAVQLAAELRRDFKMMAYCSPRNFDYTTDVNGAGFTSEGETRKMRYQNDTVIETCAVLVGNFDAIDGADIDDTFKKIKQITPKAFGGSGQTEKKVTSSAYEYRNFLRRSTPTENGAETNNANAPMRYAFKTRNPLLPAEYYKSPQVDQFVRKMNQGAPFNQYNLLDNPRKFTVRVLTFRGTDSFVSWGRTDEADTSSQATQLEIAAEKAYLVTKTLRAAGYDAYQFHDRYQSIVCVGSFDELGKENPDGKFVYAPEILEIVKRFAGTGAQVQSKFGISEQPRLLLDDIVDSKKVPELNLSDRKAVLANFRKLSVAFDLIPTPIMIPKIQATSIYDSYTFGK